MIELSRRQFLMQSSAAGLCVSNASEDDFDWWCGDADKWADIGMDLAAALAGVVGVAAVPLAAVGVAAIGAVSIGLRYYSCLSDQAQAKAEERRRDKSAQPDVVLVHQDIDRLGVSLSTFAQDAEPAAPLSTLRPAEWECERLQNSLAELGPAAFQSEANVCAMHLLVWQDIHKISKSEQSLETLKFLTRRASRRVNEWQALVKATLQFVEQRRVGGENEVRSSCRGSMFGDENCEWWSTGWDVTKDSFTEWLLGQSVLIDISPDSRTTIALKSPLLMQSLAMSIGKFGTAELAWQHGYARPFRALESMAQTWSLYADNL